MLREISVYETADGKRFDDPRKAQEHVADAIREALDSRLASLQEAGKLSANDRFAIVMALHTHLTRWLEYES
jgi:hypothetical protein